MLSIRGRCLSARDAVTIVKNQAALEFWVCFRFFFVCVFNTFTEINTVTTLLSSSRESLRIARWLTFGRRAFGCCCTLIDYWSTKWTETVNCKLCVNTMAGVFVFFLGMILYFFFLCGLFIIISYSPYSGESNNPSHVDASSPMHHRIECSRTIKESGRHCKYERFNLKPNCSFTLFR